VGGQEAAGRRIEPGQTITLAQTGRRQARGAVIVGAFKTSMYGNTKVAQLPDRARVRAAQRTRMFAELGF
jgi:hypothetical protein